MEAGLGAQNCIILWLIKWQSTHVELRVVAWMESFQEENKMKRSKLDFSLFFIFNYTILTAPVKLSSNCYIHKNGNKNSAEIEIKNNLWLCHFSFSWDCSLLVLHSCMWRQFSNFSFRLWLLKSEIKLTPHIASHMDTKKHSRMINMQWNLLFSFMKQLPTCCRCLSSSMGI